MGIATILLIVANIIISYKGFTNNLFFESYRFDIEKILVYKDYKRIITSAFLHANRTHLVFNMVTLFFFSSALEHYVGPFQFVLIYFAGLIGGEFLALFIHRNHPDFTSIGASGAVSGIVFASIALMPYMTILFFLPAWLYGIIFIIYSIYGIKSKKDNRGHESHLGGALIGMLTALLLHPQAFSQNYIVILLLTVPAILFIYLIISRPHLLLVDNFFSGSRKKNYTLDHKYNEERANKQKDIDKILDKIAKKGIKSLSSQEKQKLDAYSKTLK